MLEGGLRLICLWITGSIAGGEKREWDARLPTVVIELVAASSVAGWECWNEPLVSISCRSLEVPQVKVGKGWTAGLPTAVIELVGC